MIQILLSRFWYSWSVFLFLKLPQHQYQTLTKSQEITKKISTCTITHDDDFLNFLKIFCLVVGSFDPVPQLLTGRYGTGNLYIWWNEIQGFLSPNFVNVHFFSRCSILESNSDNIVSDPHKFSCGSGSRIPNMSILIRIQGGKH